jgi:hypothetical protein
MHAETRCRPAGFVNVLVDQQAGLGIAQELDSRHSWHPSQLKANDASEPEAEQLELPFGRSSQQL